jgi:hypothetical protein
MAQCFFDQRLNTPGDDSTYEFINAFPIATLWFIAVSAQA